MSQSITIILPTKNAADCLEVRVRELLDVVSEFSDNVELLIVDDESTDGTLDVADGLTRVFPQVRIAKCDEAEKRIAGNMYGEIVFIHADPREPIGQNTINQLKKLQQDEPVDSGRKTKQHSAEDAKKAKSVGIPTIRDSAMGDVMENTNLR